jgi:hypothetical protein
MYAKFATRKGGLAAAGSVDSAYFHTAEAAALRNEIDPDRGARSAGLQFRCLPKRLARGVAPSHPRSAPTLRVSRSGW